MKEITQDDFKKEVIESNAIVALDFYSTECPPCEALAPKFEALSQLYGNHIKFFKIFRQNNRELAKELGVSGSPTVLFFKNGQRIGDILTGGIKRADLIRNLDALISLKDATEIKKNIKPIITYCDALIIGGGPAGLTAGIYLGQAKIDTIIVDIALPGGQVSTTHQVSNFPGFLEPVPGYMLSHYMSEQAKSAGVRIKSAVDITAVDLIKKEIIIDGIETIKAKKIIIATGASPKPVNIKGEREYKGHGISYCATCDAKYFQDKEVIIIGGGNTAVEESEFISRFASKITMVHQFAKLTANKEAQGKCLNNPKINILFEHEPRIFEKKDDKMLVTVENLKTKELYNISSDGIFVFVGMSPNLENFKDNLEFDDWGYIKTDEDMRTSIKDVFAIGDVRSKNYRQITTAVADGTIAAIVVSKELE